MNTMHETRTNTHLDIYQTIRGIMNADYGKWMSMDKNELFEQVMDITVDQYSPIIVKRIIEDL